MHRCKKSFLVFQMCAADLDLQMPYCLIFKMRPTVSIYFAALCANQTSICISSFSAKLKKVGVPVGDLYQV